MRHLALIGFLALLLGCGQSQEADTSKSDQPSDTEALTETLAESAAQTTSEAASEATSEISAEAASEQLIDKSDPNWKVKVTEPEMMAFESGKTYFWQLDTSHGVMKFKLYHEESPKHANSTIYLTNIGFYDDVIFHRIIPGFMAQGGDPTGTGRGGPAYVYDGELESGLSHDKPGLLSMANRGPSTDGSQFFITFVPTPFLDPKHTIFGELVKGMDVLKLFETKGSRSGQTSETITINKATVIVE